MKTKWWKSEGKKRKKKNICMPNKRFWDEKKIEILQFWRKREKLTELLNVKMHF